MRKMLLIWLLMGLLGVVGGFIKSMAFAGGDGLEDQAVCYPKTSEIEIGNVDFEWADKMSMPVGAAVECESKYPNGCTDGCRACAQSRMGSFKECIDANGQKSRVFN